MLPLRNPHQDILHLNIRAAAKSGLPLVKKNCCAGRNAILLATGYSLTKPETLEKIRKYAKFPNNKIIALKEALRVCRENDIRADYSVSMDPGERQATEMKTPIYPGVTYMVASSCHPSLFEHLRDQKVEVFHSACGAKDPETGENEDEMYLRLWTGHIDVMGGGFTVLNRAVMLSHYMGFNKKIMIGADMGWRDGEDHYFAGAYGLNGNHSGPDINDGGVIDGRNWNTKMDMLASAADLALAIKHKRWNLHVEGDSLIRSLSKRSEAFIRAAMHPKMTPGTSQARIEV